MKITKSYLRQMIVESLEENKELPYEEFISKAVDIFHNERFYSDKMIQLFNTVNRETLKKIVYQAKNNSSDNAVEFTKIIDDMTKSFRFIANKLSDGPENPTSNRYSDEPGITVAENKTLSKDSIRQMIRESLVESALLMEEEDLEGAVKSTNTKNELHTLIKKINSKMGSMLGKKRGKEEQEVRDTEAFKKLHNLSTKAREKYNDL